MEKTGVDRRRIFLREGRRRGPLYPWPNRSHGQTRRGGVPYRWKWQRQDDSGQGSAGTLYARPGRDIARWKTGDEGGPRQFPAILLGDILRFLSVRSPPWHRKNRNR